MLLYIMLYIVLAYLMLFAASTSAVCLYNASFFAIDFCKCFLFSCFVHVYYIFLICIMHSAFNLFVFPNSMFTSLLFFCIFFNERAMSSPEKKHLKITIIIIIIIIIINQSLCMKLFTNENVHHCYTHRYTHRSCTELKWHLPQHPALRQSQYFFIS